MATGGEGSWTVLCDLCNTVVEKHGDVQESLRIHQILMHPTSDKSAQDHWRDTGKRTATPSFNKSSNNETFTCPVCKKGVVLSNDVYKSIQEHFETHSQSSRLSDCDNQLYTPSGIKDWVNHSEGFGKNNRKFKHNPKDNKFKPRMSTGHSFIFKQHEGYIQNSGEQFFCKICMASLDSMNTVEEHIKTKTHEDNIIMNLKGNFPTHLRNNMDFISFYNSNLSCNLCRCKIQSNSMNTYETIVNIMSHNSEESHSSKRTSKVLDNTTTGASPADKTLNLLFEKHSMIRDNKQFIRSNMEPKYKCVLCDKNIAYDDKENNLAKNFITHVDSSVHKKAVQAVSVLQSFEAMHVNTDPGHKFIISNNCITCIPCKCNLVSDLNELLAHIHLKANDVNPENNGQRFHASSSFNKTSRTYTKPQTSNNQQFKTNKEWKKDATFINVPKLLKPLFREFGNITCISHLEQQDQVTCVICNCSIPPTTQNIEMHLRGAGHKKCEEQLKDNHMYSKSNQKNPNQKLIDDFIEDLFQSLPYTFKQHKQYIKRCSIEGYVSCSLCNNCIINPHYLKAHLLEGGHTQRMNLIRSLP